MPELPEVETIVRSLSNPVGNTELSIMGRKIIDTAVLWERTLANMKPAEFISRVLHQRVESVCRRGKFIVLGLSKDTMLIHLRMSGDLRVEPITDMNGTNVPIQKHDRMLLVFDNHARLVFNDARKFGRVWLAADPADVLGGLGPEPLAEDLSAERFHQMVLTHQRQLKPLLMDQHFMAGLGNIYTDEALFLARLHPLRRSNSLSISESAALLNAIQSVLKEGIRANGASIDWVYRGGDFQNQFNVYGRKGEVCPVCGTEIQRLLVGQRGTHICPNCQKI